MGLRSLVSLMKANTKINPSPVNAPKATKTHPNNPSGVSHSSSNGVPIAIPRIIDQFSTVAID